MKFIKERIGVICSQLKDAVTVQSVHLYNWQKKDGCYIDVNEADKADGDFEPFDASRDRWYGKDAHYWFRSQITVPDSFDGKNLWLHIRTQLEDWDDGRNPQFLVFVNDEPVQGLDINHREILLTESAVKGDRYKIDLQAYTGTLHNEFRLLADIEERDKAVKDLYYDIQVPLWGLNRMKEDSGDYCDILNILNDTINLLDLRMKGSAEFYRSVKEASDYIHKNLYENPAMSGFDDVIATCIGHTHIDVAWLWTVAQVRQKACRSFATVLKLMDEYPDYKFMSSQPQLYEFVKERHPEMYAKIKERVKEGRWEPEGGMWVEADCNLPSGESLVRQFLFGKRFFKEEFGVENHVLWLPDVFGYSAALPQIMKKSGIKYFMTTKLAWNEYNKIPMDTFMWEGIDGSRIFTYLITTLSVGQSEKDFFTTYNGMLHPDSIMGGWDRYQNKDINKDILVSFGYGDGGGGPTREMLETGDRMKKGIKGIPKVRQEVSGKYFEELFDRVKNDRRLPSWVGELYFEFHRGTYTSMARNKRSNRKIEYRMMETEFLSVLAEKELPYPSKELNDMWKTILRNQFHDILPGSAIYEVYETTKREYNDIEEKTRNIISDCLLRILPEESCGLTVFNTLGYKRNDIVEISDAYLKEGATAVKSDSEIFPLQKIKGGAVAYVKNIPSKGFLGLSFTDADAETSEAFKITDEGISTPFFNIKIDNLGQFTSIYDIEADREILQDGHIGNEIRVYEDKPRQYDNWNIDVYYQEKSWRVEDEAKLEWIEKGPVRATLKVTKKMFDNSFVQLIHFYSGTRRIDFETEVDWKTSQHLLKVHFPIEINTDEATFDIQFGNVKRKIHMNTSWDQARFESCAHKWADLSEGGYGVSLMNDCLYGYSVIDKKFSITLLKAGTEPNRKADIEKHYFTYSLYPHIGDWRSGGTENESFNINVPLICHKGGHAGRNFSFMSVSDEDVVLETIKKAHDGNGVIVRLYEIWNTRRKTRLITSGNIAYVKETDLMENDIDDSDIKVSGNGFNFEIRPYEIKTFRVVFG